ncbi:ribonuclease H-like domain-containing protein [Mucidula mucida]|nr:ribonuclease H-like domain-containing protein [Mucidula mucida]
MMRNIAGAIQSIAKYVGVPRMYITDVQAANNAIASQLGSYIGHCGFDLEWRPSFMKGEREHPVSLVQIATSDIAFLFHVSAMDSFPSLLKDLLENPAILKVGVGIQDDAKKLFRDWNVSVLSCVDLSLLARSVDNARWKGRYSAPIGLSRLVESYFNCVLPKGRISRSNWAATLSEEQQRYAANDAHAGYAIYAHLLSIDPTIDHTLFTFHAVRGRLYAISSAQPVLANSRESSEDIIWGLASSLTPWFAFNPNYDAGPLPEAKKASTSRPPAKRKPKSKPPGRDDNILPEL